MHVNFYSVKINDTPLCQTVRWFKFHDLGSQEQGFFAGCLILDVYLYKD